MMKNSDEYMMNKRFGNWVVIERGPYREFHSSNKKYDTWVCRCDCGNQKIIFGCNLRGGHSRSCGCLYKEMFGKGKNFKHGLSNTRINHCYTSMKGRCYNNKNRQYKNYGARGIKVCDEWLGENGLQNFYNWAMANGYRDDLSIDRIDVNGNYCPENCRWATIKQQNNNKRTNRVVEYNGEEHTIKEWSEIIGMRYRTLRNRILSKNWTIEEAMTKEIKKWNPQKSRIIEMNGEKHSLSEWARIKGIRQDTLHLRLKAGWSVERALTEKVRVLNRAKDNRQTPCV